MRIRQVIRWSRYITRNPHGIKRLMMKVSDPVKSRLPWVVLDAVDYLERILPRKARVFEWGSGGSTLYFEDKGFSIVSVEYDPIWHKKIRNLLKGKFTEIYLIPPSDRVPRSIVYSRWGGVGTLVKKRVSKIKTLKPMLKRLMTMRIIYLTLF